MNLKAILCDFDGTLVDKDIKYNPDLKKLLLKLKTKGIRFSLATGRAYYSSVNNFLNQLNIFDYHILSNGALIFNNKNNKILWFQPILKESAKKIIKYLIDSDLNFTLELKDFTYMSKVIEHPSYTDIRYMKPFSKLSDFSRVLKILVFATLNNLSDEQTDFYIKNLSEICKEVNITKVKFYGKNGIDIYSDKATKHTAVLEYERLLKIPRNQIIAMGDGYNDYPLFTACGYKIAMDNAPKELKEIADFIAPTVEKNGTVIALQHIIKKFRI